MKSDVDVWISLETEASQPDELGPEEATELSESLGRGWPGQAGRQGEK